MNGQQTDPRERGTILILVMVLTMAFGFLVTFFLSHNQVQAKASRDHLDGTRALYRAYSELEKAQAAIIGANYDGMGRNVALHTAVLNNDHKINGTDAVVDALTGNDGTWFTLTVTVPYGGTEHVVKELVREIDFFSSYNLFVAENPAGISGSPIGPIHSNQDIQFFFPNGVYRNSVTAVNGVSYKSGATAANTSILGPFNPSSGRIDIDYTASDRFNLNHIEQSADPSFKFDGTNNLKLQFSIQDGKQMVHLEQWSKPYTQTVATQYIASYVNVNPHDVTYTYTQQVQTGTTTQTVNVLDHYDTVMQTQTQNVYVTDTRWVDDTTKPIYQTQDSTKQVAVYVTVTKTRTVNQQVWVPVTGSTGGTAVGGDGGQLGYWMTQAVTETYTEQVLDHYDTVPCTVQVLVGYQQKQESYQRLVGTQQVEVPVQVAVYRQDTQVVPVYTTQTLTGTKTVYDRQPVYATKYTTNYVPAALVSSNDSAAPDNGLIYTAGSVASVSGELISGMTVASRGSIMITGNLIYKDDKGNTAYLNGNAPWLSYDPNPLYKSMAKLGLVAQNDVIIGRAAPDNLEINASMLAISGRVGIEGIQLDASGEVSAFNQFTDDWGRPVTATFLKNSIRRLGGITTAKRPIETVVKSGSVQSGFNVGQAVFDVGLLQGPPPFFLPFPAPRFFATIVTK